MIHSIAVTEELDCTVIALLIQEIIELKTVTFVDYCRYLYMLTQSEMNFSTVSGKGKSEPRRGSK